MELKTSNYSHPEALSEIFRDLIPFSALNKRAQKRVYFNILFWPCFYNIVNSVNYDRIRHPFSHYLSQFLLFLSFYPSWKLQVSCCCFVPPSLEFLWEGRSEGKNPNPSRKIISLYSNWAIIFMDIARLPKWDYDVISVLPWIYYEISIKEQHCLYCLLFVLCLFVYVTHSILIFLNLISNKL